MIGRFIQEDTYYGDGLNLYTYCRNNPILNHDPTGHGTKENSPYSRKEQQYIDAGADPDTAKLATQCYPDANSKQDLYNKYKSQGYNATDAKKLANYEIVHGEERAKNYAANNVKKSGPDYTATSPRENPNTDWRTQNRFNAQKKAGAGKSGTPSGFYQDANGRWHRPNGDFASNAEVGIASPAKTATGSHGNSLSDPRTNYGYVLVDKDTNEILKFGETLYPETRYSKSYLEQNNAVMKVLESGSKEYIHYWQYDMNKYFEYMYDEFPPLLKSKGW